MCLTRDRLNEPYVFFVYVYNIKDINCYFYCLFEHDSARQCIGSEENESSQLKNSIHFVFVFVLVLMDLNVCQLQPICMPKTEHI
jgi:hypothetical protein